jgi:hypothetical protein
VVVMGLPPGWAGPEGPVGVPAGWAYGPSAAQAGGGRSRVAADSAVTCWIGWWACQDLNLGLILISNLQLSAMRTALLFLVIRER